MFLSSWQRSHGWNTDVSIFLSPNDNQRLTRNHLKQSGLCWVGAGLCQISTLQKQNHPCRWAGADLTSTKNHRMESPGTSGHRELQRHQSSLNLHLERKAALNPLKTQFYPLRSWWLWLPLQAIMVKLTLISLKTSYWNLTQTSEKQMLFVTESD